jgi:hypothetical protein
MLVKVLHAAVILLKALFKSPRHNHIVVTIHVAKYGEIPGNHAGGFVNILNAVRPGIYALILQYLCHLRKVY